MKKQINKEPNKPKQYENKSNIKTKKKQKKNGRNFSVRSLKFHSETLILGCRLYCLTYRWCKKKCYN